MATATTKHPAETPVGTKCRLLLLPAELRNRIYRLSLIYDDPIRMRLISAPGMPICEWGIPTPRLLLTSRQIRAETLPIYYGENVFDSEPSSEGGPQVVLGNMVRSGNLRLIKHFRAYRSTELYAGNCNGKGMSGPIPQERWLEWYEAKVDRRTREWWRVDGWKYHNLRPGPLSGQVRSNEVEAEIQMLYESVLFFPLRAEGVETLWAPLGELRCHGLVETDGVRRWVRKQVE